MNRQSIEDVIYDNITNSAKTKFDYSSFSEGFDKINDNLADNLLFKTLVEFASRKEKKIIAHILFNQILLTGFIVELEDLNEFVNDKDDVLKLEIFLVEMANTMLEQGLPPLHVLKTIDEFIK
ncbi:MAG: hypothetical protein EAZ27_01550 [Cytophagales bacterium]|nr:MAG: hypothetical protein EAZ27_01550 [Cytophagales bacterium]